MLCRQAKKSLHPDFVDLSVLAAGRFYRYGDEIDEEQSRQDECNVVGIDGKPSQGCPFLHRSPVEETNRLVDRQELTDRAARCGTQLAVWARVKHHRDAHVQFQQSPRFGAVKAHRPVALA